MLNPILLIGWIIPFIATVSLAIPFWLCWTVYELGQKYFGFLPVQYQEIPFWNCVGLFILISILKPTLTPTLASVSNTNNAS